MAAEATYLMDDEQIPLVTAVAVVTTEVNQLADGRAGVYAGLAAAAANDPVAYQTEGIFTVAKTTSMVFLDGGPVWWDHSANKAHYKKVNDRDFFLGSAVGDAASADTTMKVNLNVAPVYNIDVLRDGCLTVPTGTQAVGAFGYPKRVGGSFMLELTATSEAQCIDLLSVDRLSTAANPILEGIIRIPTNGSGAAVDFNIGLANGTSTTDADAVTEHVFFHIDGGALDILAQSKDGTTTVAATDTTIDATAGSAVANRFEFWIDTRDLANVKLYINGARVLSGTTFKLDAAAGPLGALMHLEKTTGTTTGQFVVDKLAIRSAQQ